MEPALKDPCCLRPQRDSTFLASLAVQLNVGIRPESNLPAAHVENFGGSSAAVVHREEQGVVTAAQPAGGIRSRQYGIHLDAGEISDQAMVGAFGGNGQDAIHNTQIGGVANGHDSKERSDGAEARIAGTDLVVPVSFEMLQEGQNRRRIQVSEGEGCGSVPGTSLQEAKQQPERITVGKDRSGA